jgi:hypothetical protein
MNFSKFIELYDKPGVVVLLEGKRKVLDIDKPRLIKLSHVLAENTKHIRFRSGNATGSDNYFAKAFAANKPDRFEVVIPYKGHRSYDSEGFNIINIEDIHLTKTSRIVIQSKSNKKNVRIFDAYIEGERNTMAMKAAYLLRDTLKVLGNPPIIKSADFAIFYDDLMNPESGGTGHTISICRTNNIPNINQIILFNWVE